MSIKSNVVDAVLYLVCSLPIVILIVLMLWLLADNAKVFQPVANEVANNVTNRVTTIETEVYRVVCVEEKSGYCGAYSVRRINKE